MICPVSLPDCPVESRKQKLLMIVCEIGFAVCPLWTVLNVYSTSFAQCSFTRASSACCVSFVALQASCKLG